MLQVDEGLGDVEEPAVGAWVGLVGLVGLVWVVGAVWKWVARVTVLFTDDPTTVHWSWATDTDTDTAGLVGATRTVVREGTGVRVRAV